MPIEPKIINTYEAKVERIYTALSRLPLHDKLLIIEFIRDLAKRFKAKSEELEKFIRSDIEELDRRYIEQVLKDFNNGV